MQNVNLVLVLVVVILIVVLCTGVYIIYIYGTEVIWYPCTLLKAHHEMKKRWV